MPPRWSVVVLIAACTSAQDWTTWGGPSHDFTSASKSLATKWPADGPKRIWSRDLGDGYSAIAVEGKVLYTAFRRGTQDVVTALDARSGKTLWEYAYDARFRNAYSEAVGPGPYAMPQVIGDRVVNSSGTGRINSIDKKTGKLVWSKSLYSEFGGTNLDFGYSCHPLPYRDYLIVFAGGKGKNSAVVALKQSDGSVVWKNGNFTNAHSSPLLISVDGQPQVVALTAQEVSGFNPENGERLWMQSHPTQNGLAISTPVWSPETNLLFLSSAYSGGARVLELHQKDGKTAVRHVWHHPKLQLHFGTAIRQGDTIYLSSGHSGPAFLSAVELRTGKILWQTREFQKAQLLLADNKLIVLDQDGMLGLVEANPAAYIPLAQTSLLKHLAWTPPTLSGRTLYIRDRNTIMAVDLGR